MPSLVHKASGSQTTPSATSLTINISSSGQGHVIVVAVCATFFSARTLTATDNLGNIYVQRGPYVQSGSFQTFFTLPNLPSGITSVIIQMPALGVAEGVFATVLEYSGITGFGQLKTVALGATSAVTQSEVTQAANNFVVTMFVGDGNQTSYAATNGTVEGSIFAIASACFVVSDNSGGAVGSTVTNSGTLSGSSGNSEAFAFSLELSTRSVNFVQAATPVGNLSNVTTLSSVLPFAPPAAGNLVCAALGTGGNMSGLTVLDGNSNAYAITPNSPSLLGAAKNWLAYLVSAPVNASATIVFNWTTGVAAAVFAVEFCIVGTNFAFDNDVIKSNGTASGTNVNLPSIVPSFSNEVLFALCNPASSITAPVAGAVLGVWTGGGIDSSTSIAVEWVIGASSPTVVNFTDSTSGDSYGANAMAFYQVQTQPVTSEALDDGVSFQLNRMGSR